MVYKLANGHKVLTVYFHCSLKTSLLRNKKRRPHIPEKAVYIIYHQFEKPKSPDISIDTDKTRPEEATSKILKKIKLTSY